MTDVQNYRIYNLPEDAAILDLDLSFIASVGDVHFGDTKEGGIISIRVHPSMNASDGGKMENAFGGINEAETWGKRANWCDYSGVVDGNACWYCCVRSYRQPTLSDILACAQLRANGKQYIRR